MYAYTLGEGWVLEGVEILIHIIYYNKIMYVCVCLYIYSGKDGFLREWRYQYILSILVDITIR